MMCDTFSDFGKVDAGCATRKHEEQSKHSNMTVERRDLEDPKSSVRYRSD